MSLTSGPQSRIRNSAVFFILALLPELKSKGKAVLVITHDDHFFQYADRIIKLDFGALERATPLESEVASQLY